MTQRRSTACKTSIPAIHLGSVPFCLLPDYLKISACFKDIGRSLSQAGSKWKEKLGDFPQLFAQPCRSLQHHFEAGGVVWAIGSGYGDCAPTPSHTTGHAVFRIRRLKSAL